MTLATQDEIVDAEIVLNDEQAEEFDLRFQYALGGYAEARQELIECVQCVRGSNVAERLGFKSRGDYIADRVANLNVKWAVDDRRSLVELMAYDKDGGMSTRQIGSALGVSHPTVMKDMKSTGNNLPVERKVESSDGKTRTYTTNTDWPEVPEPEPERGNGENRHTDIINGTRNDLNLIAGNYTRYVKAIGKEVPRENLPQRGNEYIIQYLKESLAEITAATEAAISKLEGERK